MILKKVFLDTNALMAISEFKLDIFTETMRVMDFKFQFYVLSGTIEELEKIVLEQRGRFKVAAKLALLLLKKRVTEGTIKVLQSEGYVDDILIEKSRSGGLVLTQDMALKRKLQKPYLTIRQKKKVVLVK